MCYEDKCSKCGKTSWAGCGRHVASVYGKIPQGQHCHCKPWPGVAAANGDTSAAASTNDNQTSASSSTTCTIL